MPIQLNQFMTPGAFVLKLKTLGWRLCVVKQVPEQSSSCWMLFGQTRNNPNTGTGTGPKTTVQMEFQPHQETALINHLTDLAEHDETELRLVLVSEPPAVSCFESLWSLQGQEMYRKQHRSSSTLLSSLHQDLNMLRISPQMQQMQQHQHQHQQQQQQQQQHQQQQQPQGNRNQNQQSKQSMHSMQTRSKSSA